MIKRTIPILIIVVVSFGGPLLARYQEIADGNDLSQLTDSASEKNLFDAAYEIAKGQLYAPVSDALDQTTQIINNRCDGQGVTIQDVMRVFDQTQVGRELHNHHRLYDDTYPENDLSFADACTHIVTCYYRDDLLSRGVERDDFQTYTAQTRQSCLGVVTSLYRATYQTASSHETLRNDNYGDDLYTNAENDAAYDIMLDIEEIGDHLFVNNTSPVPVPVYNLPQSTRRSDIGGEDDETSPASGSGGGGGSESGNSNQGSSGSQPSDRSQSSPVDQYDPGQFSSSDRTLPTQGMMGVVPSRTSGQYPHTEMGVSGPSGTDQSVQWCLPPDTYQGTERSPSYAQQAQITRESLDQLEDLAQQELDLSIILANRYTRREEEVLGDDDPSNDPPPSVVQELEAYELDLEGSGLDGVKNHIQGCIDQFTDKSSDSREQIVAQSITQPGAFTECVFAGLCEESSDPSGLGIFTIKICKEPKKTGAVVGNKTAKSVEQIIDTLNTTCNGLQESGQLLKHNQTKDHRDHKLMNIKLQDIFSFGLSVSFDKPQTVRNYAQEKREQIQNNALLERRLLGITPKLTSLQQRNKYRIVRGGFVSSAASSSLPDEQQQTRQLLLEMEADYLDAQSLPRMSQQLTTLEVSEQLQQFIDDNIAFWEVTNESTRSLQQTRGSAYLKRNN